MFTVFVIHLALFSTEGLKLKETGWHCSTKIENRTTNNFYLLQYCRLDTTHYYFSDFVYITISIEQQKLLIDWLF